MLCPVCGNTDFYLKEEHLEQVFKNETIEIKAEVMVCKTKDCFYKHMTDDQADKIRDKTIYRHRRENERTF